MRIVCQKCAAAYGIDDRVVSSQGVRAQCPRCRAIQMVRREDALPNPENAATTMPSIPRLSSRMPHPPPFEEIELSGPRTLTGEVDDSLLSDEARPTAAQRCRLCGKPLDDAFDLALGVCPDCSLSEAEEIASGEVTEVTSPPRADEQTVIVPNPAKNRQRAPSAALTEHEKTMETRIPGELGSDPTGEMNATQVRASPLRRRRAVFAAAAVLVLAVGGVLFARRAARGRGEGAVAEGVGTALARWKRQVGEPQGESSAFLAEGGAQLAVDTPAGYAQAVRAFQRALLLDPNSDEAIAGYVQALAIGWSDEGLDNETYDEAERLISEAQRRSGRDAASLVAHANLVLSKPPNPDRLQQAKSLADEALKRAKGQDRAEALVAQGRVLLVTSPRQAGQVLESALALPEAPRRAQFFRALAHRANGEYREALAQLQRRLATDPAHLETLALLARIYEEVGEPALARDAYLKALEKSPGQPQIVVALAALRYRALMKTPQAVDALSEVAHEPSAEPEVRRDALVHLAAANRTAGKLDAAQVAVADALALDATYVPAHLQGLLTALDAEKAENAATHLAALKGRLAEPGLEALLEGRVAVAQGNFAEAVTDFESAAKLDPRRLDARLWAGAAAASGQIPEEAYRILGEAILADPTRLGPLPEDPRLYVTSADLLSGIENRVGKQAPAADASARLYEGLLRFHTGDLAASEQWLRQALASDDRSAPGHALRALAALGRNDRGGGKVHAERAIRIDPQLALAHFALGQALLSSGDLGAAEKALAQTITLMPGFLAAEVSMAEIEKRRNHMDEARARLTRVVGLDNAYLPAKRALYLLER